MLHTLAFALTQRLARAFACGMNDKREEHQREIERGLTLQLTPELERSEAWRRVWMAAHLEGRSVIKLVADGIMAAVEAAEDVLREQRGLN